MRSSIHRSARGRRDALARLRGGSAGAVSGAVSIAAHGWAAATAAPGSSTLALLAGASAVVGALVAGIGPLRDTTSGLIAALIAGQLLGHLTLGYGSGHPQHGADLMSRQMLAAHILAAVFAALVIRGVESADRIGTTVLTRALPPHRDLPDHLDPAPPRTTHRDRVILRVLATRSSRTRAPPHPVFA